MPARHDAGSHRPSGGPSTATAGDPGWQPPATPAEHAARWGSVAEPDRSVYLPPAVRIDVAFRMISMSLKHTEQAWLRRRRDPISGHGLAYLFQEPLSQVGRSANGARAATRLYLAEEETADLPHLLFGVQRVAHEYISEHTGRRRRFALYPDLAARIDPMSGVAAFTGVAVSTLDTPHGTWRTVQRRARGMPDVPGRCFVQLIDGSRLLVDRGATQQFNDVVVQSSVNDVNVSNGVSGMRWRFNPTLAEIPADDPDADVWRWLGELTRTVHDFLVPR